MSDRRRLVYSMLQFCSKELQSADLSEDAKESLEVACQCLQSAYALTLEDKHLEVSHPLEDIFKQATLNEPLHKKSPPSPAEKEEAEKLKNEGNNLMRTEKFEEALQMYSKAIELDGSNPVFYCNRAAAHSKMNAHHLAIEDCQRAIDMDPNYSKAYGRMGLANSSLEKHKEAVDNFKKALELEPDNDSYKSNLQIAEDKVKTIGNTGPRPGMPGFPMGPGGFDIGSFLNNPALMNMASSMLQDPNMQNMMAQLMSGGLGGGAGGQGAEGPPPSMEGLLQAGQQMAQQMVQTNPELVEQLRRQLGGGAGFPPGPPPPPSDL